MGALHQCASLEGELHDLRRQLAEAQTLAATQGENIKRLRQAHHDAEDRHATAQMQLAEAQEKIAGLRTDLECATEFRVGDIRVCAVEWTKSWAVIDVSNDSIWPARQAHRDTREEALALARQWAKEGNGDDA